MKKGREGERDACLIQKIYRACQELKKMQLVLQQIHMEQVKYHSGQEAQQDQDQYQDLSKVPPPSQLYVATICVQGVFSALHLWKGNRY
jgi:hypothetical protein